MSNLNKLDFLTPNAISLIILVSEFQISSQQNFQMDVQSPLARFIIQKIMQLNQSEKDVQNYKQFVEQLFQATNISEICQKYIDHLRQITSINSLFFYLSTVLKKLRMQQNSKLEQGSLIDLFVRRCHLSFTKKDFGELVSLYEMIDNFKKDSTKFPQKNNKFQFQNKIDETKLKIEQYFGCESHPSISQQIKRLEKIESSSNSINYLKLLLSSKTKTPIRATKSLHKYFDKSINLLQPQERGDQSSNKIHHSTLNLAYSNLKLGFLDEALRGISETLRIAQNNSDDESINHCLIYLYQIAGILGYYKDQIVLIEHAIFHSYGFQNPALLLLSSMAYGQLHRSYHIDQNAQGNYMKIRNLEWNDALQYASKRIVQQRDLDLLKNQKDNSLKQIIAQRAQEHLIKSVLFQHYCEPILMNLHTSVVENINSDDLYDERCTDQFLDILENTQNFDLQKCFDLIRMLKKKLPYKELRYFYFYLIVYDILLNFGNFDNAKCVEEKLLDLVISFEDPILVYKIWKRKNERLMKLKLYKEAFQSIQNLMSFNKSKGFVKQNIGEYLKLAQIYQQTGKIIQSLIITQESIKLTKQYLMFEEKIHFKLYLTLQLLEIGQLQKPIKIIHKIEQYHLQQMSLKLQAFFNKIKALLLLKLSLIQDSNELMGSLKEKALFLLNKAQLQNKIIGNMNNLQEILYIKAQVHNDLGQYQQRDKCAKVYIQINTQAYISLQNTQFQKQEYLLGINIAILNENHQDLTDLLEKQYQIQTQII